MAGFGRHLFVCTHERPAGHPRECCSAKDSVSIREPLKVRGKAASDCPDVDLEPKPDRSIGDLTRGSAASALPAALDRRAYDLMVPELQASVHSLGEIDDHVPGLPPPRMHHAAAQTGFGIGSSIWDCGNNRMCWKD